MRSASVYRVSGNSLMLAAVLWVVSLLLLPRGTANTVAEAFAHIGPLWITSALLGLLGFVLAIAGMVGFYRHFVGSEQEGWALLGTTTGVAGAILYSAAMAIAAVGLPFLLQMAQTAGQPPSEAAGAAMILTLSGLYAVGGTLMWLALIPYGLAMLRDAAWPRAVAWGAVVAGIVEPLGGIVLMRRELPWLLLSILGFAFLALLGNVMVRIPRVATPAPTPERAGAV